MDPRGVRREGLGVREDYKSKVMYPLIPLLQGFRGPQEVVIDTLGVRGTFFNFKGSTESKKLRTTGLDQISYSLCILILLTL